MENVRVVIASSEMPFAPGGASLLVDWLELACRQHGHEVETFRLPFESSPSALLTQYLAFRLLDAASGADRLITLRPPSHLLPHPNKVAWFIHHLRGAFDLWGTPYQDIPASLEGAGIREALRSADTAALAECRHLFVNSKVMASRVASVNGLQAKVLYPPLWQSERFSNLGDDGYFLYVSRITPHKRQHLAVEAAALMRSHAPIVIAGPVDPVDQPYLESIQSRIAALNLSHRVRIESSWISEEQKAQLVGRCRALLYFPFDEDSYGFPVLEAFSSAKPVVTMSDSGGTLEVIRHAENGLISAPSPEALAAALDQLAAAPVPAMGAAASETLSRLRLSWPQCVEALLA